MFRNISAWSLLSLHIAVGMTRLLPLEVHKAKTIALDKLRLSYAHRLRLDLTSRTSAEVALEQRLRWHTGQYFDELAPALALLSDTFLLLQLGCRESLSSAAARSIIDFPCMCRP